MNRALSLRTRALTRRALAAALLAPALLAAPPAADAQTKKQDGFVYVGTNTQFNMIMAFRRDAGGHLYAPRVYPTGGMGVFPVTPDVLGVFDSDQNIVTDAAGKRLFAVNSGSDTIAVFDIRHDGSLAPVKGSPFPSGGRNPVSLGVSGNILTVVNKDYDLGRPGFNALTRHPNNTSFLITKQGKLLPIPGATVLATPAPGTGPGVSVPTQSLVSNGGRVVFDTDFFGLHLKSFRILPGGQLALADSQTLPASESPSAGNPFGLAIPLGLQVHPKTNVLYVGFVLDQRIGVYEYNELTGRMTFLRSVVATGDALVGVCWLVTNKQGTRLYATGNFNNTIAVLDISDARNPRLLQTVTLAQGMGNPTPNFPGNAAPFQIALDPAGKFLHVVTQLGAPGQNVNANSVQVLKVDGNGLLHLVDAVILPTFPYRPQGVVAR
ncbi:MAG: beta-propeller fold lactonase family protein [Isosphaeraceae bacterium]